MGLQGTVTQAAAGLLGFDSDSVITSDLARTFVAQGYAFCIRYVSRVAAQGPSDLTSAEAEGILQAGLALMPVQHVRAAGWAPTAALGSSDGVHAAYHAFVLGLPLGVNIWCDLEGVAGGSTADDVVAYCNAWFDAVTAAGYAPGLYVGAGAVLDDQALHSQLKFSHYWRSLSNVPDIAVRGYQMVQSNEHTVNGVGIDDDRTQTDALGGTVMWMTAAPAVGIGTAPADLSG